LEDNLSKLERYFSDKLLRSIGLLLVTASACEHTLALQMARLMAHPLEIDTTSLVALSGTETRVRIQQIQVLAHLKLGQNAEPVLDVCDKIRHSFDHRNELAHYLVASETIASDKVALKHTKLNAKHELPPPKTYTTDQIREFARVLHEQMGELDRLLTSRGIRKIPVPPGSILLARY
jgi:hypothetical protein